MPKSINPYYSGAPSDHFDGVRFFNPGHPKTDRGFRDLLRWKLKERAAQWPRSVPVRETDEGRWLARITLMFAALTLGHRADVKTSEIVKSYGVWRLRSVLGRPAEFGGRGGPLVAGR